MDSQSGGISSQAKFRLQPLIAGGIITPMMDMLVRLYDLPPLQPELDAMKAEGISVFRALPPNRNMVVEWVREHTSDLAAGEAEGCFGSPVPSVFIAVKDGKILGYACYNATAPDFFGPTEVDEEYRGMGIGRALLISALSALRDEGYAYAIIGGVGPAEFYSKCAGAVLIEGSDPGIYSRMLRPRTE